MNILVNGTSISRGLGSWPYYLMDRLPADKFNLVNLAQAGSGNTYIHESTVEEVANRKYDLVIIQWTYANRFDIRVKDIARFKDSAYTSDYQSQQNDWPGKVIWPVNDQDYVQKNWIFGVGYINELKDDNLGKVFKEYYRVTRRSDQIAASLIKIISLQNTLKAMNVPYLFTSYRPLPRIARFAHLHNLIDWDNFYSGPHLHKVAKDNNQIDDTFHPYPEAQLSYANILYEDLIARKLINV